MDWKPSLRPLPVETIYYQTGFTTDLGVLQELYVAWRRLEREQRRIIHGTDYLEKQRQFQQAQHRIQQLEKNETSLVNDAVLVGGHAQALQARARSLYLIVKKGRSPGSGLYFTDKQRDFYLSIVDHWKADAIKHRCWFNQLNTKILALRAYIETLREAASTDPFRYQ